MENNDARCIRCIYSFCNNNKHLQHFCGADRARLLQDQGQRKADFQKRLSFFSVQIYKIRIRLVH